MFLTGRYGSTGWLMQTIAVIGAGVLAICVFVIVQSLLEGFLSGRPRWECLLAPGKWASRAVVRFTTKYVFGMHGGGEDGDEDANGDEWHSRAEYLVNSIQFVISQAETRLDERMALTTEQTASAVRSLWSTVVVEDVQAENIEATTSNNRFVRKTQSFQFIQDLANIMISS